MPVSSSRAAWMALLLLPIPALAAAQSQADADAPPVPATELGAVSVQAARHDSRRDDSPTRIVFGSEELSQHGDASLVDALRRLPGVTVGTPAPGRSGAIALRGMGAGYTQILVDGHPPPSGFDIGTLTPEMVERVEILRAPTANQRAEAIAGTLNIVLAAARPQDSDLLTLNWTHAGNGRQQPSATGLHRRQRENGSHALVATASRRVFLVEESGSERGVDALGDTWLSRTTRLRAEGHREVLRLAPDVEMNLGGEDTLRLRGTAEASRFARNTDIEWETLQGPPLRHARYRQDTRLEVALLQGDVRWTRQTPAGGRSEARLNVGGNRERSRFAEHARDAGGIPSLQERTDSELQVQEISGSGSHAFPTHGRHGVQVGWEGSIDRRREERMQAIAHFGWQPDTRSDQAFDARVRRLAFHAQDEFTLGAGWSFYLGARWEQIETRSTGSDHLPVISRQQVFSPLLQSLWKLPGKRADRFRFALTRSFKAPPLAALTPRPYTSNNNRPMDPDRIGNPRLRPELATGIDMAWESGGAGPRLNLGGYLRRIEGVVRDELHQRDGRWCITPGNGGDAVAWGLEMDGALPLSVLFDDAPAVELRFNATQAWSRVQDVPGPDNRLPGQARFSTTLAADYRINPRWSAGIGYAYRSGGKLRTTPLQADFQSPVRELDLHATWKMNPKARVRLSASNLLSQDALRGQRYSTEDGDLQSTRVRRGTPLFQLQLEIRP